MELKKYGFLLAAILVLFGCQKYENIGNNFDNAEPEYAFPLLSGKKSIRSILEDFGTGESLIIDPTGLITLNYKGDLAGRKASEIWTLFETIPFVLTDSVFAIPLSDNTNLDIEKIIYKDGFLRAAFTVNATEDVDVHFSIPQLTKNGLPFEKTVPLKFTGVPIMQGILDTTYVSGYALSSTNDTAYIKARAYTKSGKEVKVQGFGTLSMLKFSYAQGYWGREVVDLPRDTIPISFFDKWVQGSIYFENPTIRVNVINSFGVPTRSVINTLRIFTVKGTELDLSSPDITSGIDFAYPGLNEVGQTKSKSFYFDSKNSNIATILGDGPKAVDYDIDFIANPDNDINIKGFMTDSSYFLFQVDVLLPFYGKAKEFEAKDTFAVDFSNFADENIANAELKLIVENGIPLEALTQGYFLDASGKVIDSLFTQDKLIIPAAPIDNTGKATGKTKEITFIAMDEARFNKVRNSKKIIVRSRFSTTNKGNTSVRIESNQEIDVRMGLKVKVKP